MDLLTALWPYLMGALVGWMASWGLAHRFKYATDSTKTIRVEKVVEKVVEVDRQELVDRLAEAEARLRDYQRQDNATPRRPPAKQPGEIGRQELIEKLTELESTVTDYGAEGDRLRSAASVKPAAATAGDVSRTHPAARSASPESEPQKADAELVALRSAPPSATEIEIETLSPRPEPTRPEKARKQPAKRKQSGAAAQGPADAPVAPDTSQLALPVERPNGSAAASAVQAQPNPGKRRSRKAANTRTPADTAATPASSAADQPAKAPAKTPKKRSLKAGATQPPAETAVAAGRDTSEQSAAAPATGSNNGERIEIDWAGARAVGFAFKDPGERTDFTYIEGIGPKISTLLLDAGIESYHHLASTSGADLREILDGAGPRYRLADPTSWPQQAAMIAGSRWQALNDWKQKQRQGKSTASETS